MSSRGVPLRTRRAAADPRAATIPKEIRSPLPPSRSKVRWTARALSLSSDGVGTVVTNICSILTSSPTPRSRGIARGLPSVELRKSTFEVRNSLKKQQADLVDLESRSSQLFGRYDALTLYLAIASLPKEGFSTGEVVALTGVLAPTVSKELGRLCSLGFVRPRGRRGQFERCSSSFWTFVQELGEEWSS